MDSQQYFLKIPIWMLQTGLSHSAMLLYAVLVDLCDHMGICDVSQAELAHYCGLSSRQIRRLVKELIDAEMIEQCRTGRASYFSIEPMNGIEFSDWSALRLHERKRRAERRAQ